MRDYGVESLKASEEEKGKKVSAARETTFKFLYEEGVWSLRHQNF